MKNIDINAVQLRRYETYEKEKDNLIVVRIEGGYTVSNIKKASTYSVTKNANSGDVECTCKDFNNYKEYDIRCKHIIAVSRKATRVSIPVINTENNIIKEEIIMSSNENSQTNNPIVSESIKHTIQEILSRPFEKELIRYREGQKKKQLAYVETVNYVERLNEAFGFKWTWEIVSETITEFEVYCKGKLSVKIAGEVVEKEAFGGKDLTVVDVWDKQTGKVIGKKPYSLADDLKSASSDALKKACSLLGIGLHLYKSTNKNTINAPAGPHTIPAAKPQAPAHTVPKNQASTAPVTPAHTTAPPTAPAQVTTQPAGFNPKKTSGGNNGNGGGNGKGGNGAGGDINRIIERW